ncbi:MAG: MFS transporter [Verrucomicrobiales bacterium]
MSILSTDERERETFRLELFRAPATGILETAFATFMLLVAVRYFESGPTAKALLNVGNAIGLLLSPFAVSFVLRRQWRVGLAAARLQVLSGFGWLTAALAPNEAFFILGCLTGMMGMTSATPLLTEIFQKNYHYQRRGHLFSQAAFVRIATAGVFAWLGGVFLEGQIGRYPAIFLIFSAAAFVAALCLSKLPSEPLKNSSDRARPKVFYSMRYLKEDRVLRHVLISWMLMGLGNLIMIPLRVEYLANPVHGISMDEFTIALVVGVVPNVSRLACTLVWGKLFDRLNFFIMRIILNLGFILGVLAFFAGDNLGMQILGGLLFGVSITGGDVAWSLWVTKVAQPDRTADYMALHTFFTGIRAMIAPFLAFYLIQFIAIPQLSLFAAFLIFLSIVFLFGEARRPDQGDPNDAAMGTGQSAGRPLP